MSEPFILTLMLDPAVTARFDALRSAHFPAHRLFVGAHVTLFHALPRDPMVAAAIATETASIEAFPIQVSGLRLLGRGVAFVMESLPLRQLRDRLRQLWMPRLTPQDRQPWQPHLTIQNKVDAAVARRLFARMQAEFTPYQISAIGLALWIYRGGPWEGAGRFAFKN